MISQPNLPGGLAEQINEGRRAVAERGLSGTAILDLQPAKGIIRLRVSLSPPQKLEEFITSYGEVIVMGLRLLNVETKKHVSME
jgi:hypothetical protein